MHMAFVRIMGQREIANIREHLWAMLFPALQTTVHMHSWLTSIAFCTSVHQNIPNQPHGHDGGAANFCLQKFLTGLAGLVYLTCTFIINL